MAPVGGIAGELTIAAGGGVNRDDVHPVVASRSASASVLIIGFIFVRSFI